MLNARQEHCLKCWHACSNEQKHYKLIAKCLFAVLCVVWSVFTLYIVMSEQPAAARIYACSLSKKKKKNDRQKTLRISTFNMLSSGS